MYNLLAKTKDTKVSRKEKEHPRCSTKPFIARGTSTTPKDHKISRNHHVFTRCLERIIYISQPEEKSSKHHLSRQIDRYFNMGFGAALTSASIAEYVAQPFIRTALAQPRSPSSVLSFFLGIDYGNAAKADEELKSGDFLTTMSPFWFGGHPDYDQHCRTAFTSLVREAGKKELDGNEWKDTVDGQVAQLILCDQLSRNVFRGSEEAFAYDNTSLDIAKLLANDCIMASKNEEQEQKLQGVFYPTYTTFAATALMHSEELEDHDLCLEILEWAAAETSEMEWWDGQKSFLLDHKEVIEEFGRYPHRNANKGRKNTAAEEAWLANADDLPGWAKSQGKPK